MVKTVFAQRQTDGKELGINYRKEKAAALEAMQLSHEIRPDKLTVDQFAELTRRLFDL